MASKDFEIQQLLTAYRKGLISDQGEKKQAFFVLQKAYKDKTLGKAE